MALTDRHSRHISSESKHPNKLPGKAALHFPGNVVATNSVAQRSAISAWSLSIDFAILPFGSASTELGSVSRQPVSTASLAPSFLSAAFLHARYTFHLVAMTFSKSFVTVAWQVPVL